MAGFSIVRVPYYICVAVFSGLAALIAYINNTTVTGVPSDIYLVEMVGALLLCLAAIRYMFAAKSGEDDEADLQVGGLTLGKKAFYIAVFILALIRLGSGYYDNHVGTGFQSTWGIAWILVSLGLLLFTYANFRSYIGKTAKPVV